MQQDKKKQPNKIKIHEQTSRWPISRSPTGPNRKEMRFQAPVKYETMHTKLPPSKIMTEQLYQTGSPSTIVKLKNQIARD